MSYNATFCWIMFATPLFFHQNAEAVFNQQAYNQARDRILLTYNPNTDPCVKVSHASKLEAKEAANLVCKRAFKALDSIEGNSCHGWRSAACRQLAGFEYHQCSCEISSCNAYEIASNVVNSFRDCAWKVYAEELFTNQTPAPSIDFQYKRRKIHDEAMEKARFRRFPPTSSEPGTSYAPRGSSFSGAGSMRAGGTAHNVGAANVLDTSPSQGVDINPIFLATLALGPFLCDVCSRPYANMKTLSAHRVSHEIEILCRFCNRPYSNKGNLTLHMKRFHPNIGRVLEPGSSSSSYRVRPISVPPKPIGPYVCDQCGKRFEWAISLRAHERKHTEDFVCKVCDSKEFSNKSNYTKHMKQYHPEIAEAEAAEARAKRISAKPVICETCGERFKEKKRLQEHLPLHRGETHCDACNVTFPRKAALKIHIRKEHSKRN